mmetsp:Transcript_25338/g.58729  ORF Transcript_25338/g.58729 Transcript_25338/m.58729 type:complete len:84 (-) Transcript_25338:1069-1320(-)
MEWLRANSLCWQIRQVTGDSWGASLKSGRVLEAELSSSLRLLALPVLAGCCGFLLIRAPGISSHTRERSAAYWKPPIGEVIRR